ncbi:hypothetical protein WM11_21700 [Burkholderia ubonensis]|uniref:hypothetical protein n=1 Tax=Burkholderia ubonensis TaxID=101571 RepID=UPI00075CEDA0|nr:hypothetical protein [Burkholderia ubonensis]KWI89580.1 hypothetical protein WM10_17610 [Burkholderia ubonensis]KWI99225.1 hypothetical protein WM11_21700 [Burkholderia ubonensis]KWK03271.1 hypothetical protein WM12_27985 [Burkholderia ubonensis]KWK44236.1 hypothetical protein WM14_11820 [Burkholderia ubonensis]KWK46302.1 hypothetical protein WM13_06390 [Burkholderia ubonensis]
MEQADKRDLMSELNLAFEAARQPLPSPQVLRLFWDRLERYPLRMVLTAIRKHIDVSEFAPTPASILKHLPKPSDDRPEADEAWAIAIRSVDERETVVWTQEIAEAWAIAAPVFHGDEIGARMAFKAAYARIVERNRGVGIVPHWVVSQGFDAARREEVVAHAVHSGRLQLAYAKAAVPLLTGNSDQAPAVDVEANLARLKAMVAGIGSAQARASAEKSARVREDAEHTAELKRAAARRVAGYAAEVRA